MDTIPNLFWKIIYLYNALSIMTYIPISDIFTEAEIISEIECNTKQYEMHSKFKEQVPKWYKELS